MNKTILINGKEIDVNTTSLDLSYTKVTDRSALAGLVNLKIIR